MVIMFLNIKIFFIISGCEKYSSFNYKDRKQAIYFNDHKLESMVNVEKQPVDKCNCLICDKFICRNHCFSKEHITNFENNISVKTKDSMKGKFIDLIFVFHIIDKNVFYKDLYFKDYLKKIIIKNCDKDKNYKITLYKFNEVLIKDGSLRYWVEKYILQNISDIDNIEDLKIKNNSNDLESINIEVEFDIGN